MNEIKKLLQSIVKQYIAHNKIEVKQPEVLNERYLLRGKEYFSKIQETVNKDTQAASFGIPTKKLTQLQRSAMHISLTHGLTKFAEYLVTGKDTLNEIN